MFPLPPDPPPPGRVMGGGISLAIGMGGEGSLRAAVWLGGEGRVPRREPRWGSGGPSLGCKGEAGRTGGIGGDSRDFGEGVLGEVTLFGRGGATSPAPLLATLAMDGRGRSLARCEEGEGCLPLVDIEEGVW